MTSVRPAADAPAPARPAPRRPDGFLLSKQPRRALAAVALLAGGSYAVSVLVRQGSPQDAVWDTVIGPAAALLGIPPMLRRRSAPGFGVSTAAAAFVLALLLSSLIVIPEASHPLGEESVAGALSWLAPYPLIALHLVLLARARLRRVPGSLWLDAALFASAAGAALGATLLDPVMRAAGSALGAVVFTADLALLGFALGIVAATGWRRDPQLWSVAIGAACLAGSDISAILGINVGQWHLGYWNGVFFAGAVLFIEGSCWGDPRSSTRSSPAEPSIAVGVLAVPLCGALVATAVLFAGSRTSLPAGTEVLAAVAALLSVGRWYVDAVAARAAVEQRARTLVDDLTGIGNRRALLAVLDPLCAGTDLDRPPGARVLVLLLVDLDGFRKINDVHGNETGDAALVAVARRLRSQATNASVARIGGDEFAVCALVADQDAAAALGLRLQQAVSGPLGLALGEEQRMVRLHPSIGGVWTEAAPVRRNALLRAADATLDDVKRRGGGLVLTEATRVSASPRHPR